MIGPVIEVVVTEQANIGDKDAGIDIEPVSYIPVIAAPRFGNILVRVGEIPLAAAGAGVITRSRRSKQSIHGQDAASDIVDVDVAANADLFKLPLIGTKSLS